MRTAVVVMGVAGAGKTTVAAIVSARLDWQLAEGEHFLSPESRAKLEAGRNLHERDRQEWLESLRQWISRSHTNKVVTCSALRRSYRDVLREATARVVFVHLEGSREVIRDRTLLQSDHHVPRTQLDAQLDLLEPLEPDEDGVVVSVAQPPTRVAQAVLTFLGFDF